MRSTAAILSLCAGLLPTSAGLHPLAAQDGQTTSDQPLTGELTIQGASLDDGVRHDYTIYLRGDEMRVDDAEWKHNKEPSGVGQSMIFRLSGATAGMIMIDHGKKQVYFLALEDIHAAEPYLDAKMNAVSAEGPGVDLEERAAKMGFGLPESIEVLTGGKERTVSIAPHDATFHYEGEASVPGMKDADMPPEARGMMTPVMKIDGTALVDPRVEGADVLAAFYQRLAGTNLLAPGGTVDWETPSMTSGLMLVNAWITSAGFPVVVGMDTEISFKMEGAMARMARLMPKVKSSSFTLVNSISSDPVDPAIFYNGGMPPGYKVEKIEPRVGATSGGL